MLEEHIAVLNGEITTTKTNAEKQKNEIYGICEQRKEEAIYALQGKIKELAHELASSVEKIRNKNAEIDVIERREAELQTLMKENHALLAEEKGERETLAE